MKPHKIILSLLLISQLIFALETDKNETTYLTPASIEATCIVKPGKGDYKAGDRVSLNLSLTNKSTTLMSVKEINVILKDLSVKSFPVLHENNLAANVVVNPNATITIDADEIYNIPFNSTGTRAIKVLIECVMADGGTKNIGSSFFRIVNNSSLINYEVNQSNYNNLAVFTLTGGMSAEFGVQSSLASLKGGISHSWYEAPNTGGPFPVLSTPDFLQRSINKTIDLYEGVLGASTKVKTVIIGTGIPTTPYLSMAMSAVYLPLHFLVSSNTVAEIESILDHSQQAGYEAYATYGYDGSMPNVGVAWIKLLDLPEEYRTFIENHDVEEVVLMGVGEHAYGETYARKVIKENQTNALYEAGAVYILYTNSGTEEDIAALNSRIYDLSAYDLYEGANIADWESGITDSQIANFSNTINNHTLAKSYSITSHDLIYLYNLSSWFSLKSIQKNESQLNAPYVKGVIFNEYLVSHPQYEVFWGYIPLAYWQFVPATSTVDRSFGYLRNALASYYPDIATNFTNQKFYLNSNYGREYIASSLIAKGVNSTNITIRNQADGDRWNPQNGMYSPCEVFANQIVNNVGAEAYVAKVKSLTPLSINDIREICLQAGNVDFLYLKRQFTGGSGTKEDPFLISTAQELQAVAAETSASFKLINNIDLSSVSWEPIGNPENKFTGNFDGNGKIISNITVSGASSNRGLFGVVSGSAIIKNTYLEQVSIIGIDHIGGIAGYIESGTIRNCSVKGAVVAEGAFYAGGIVGRSVASSPVLIENCVFNGTVTSYFASGGIVGGCATMTTIKNCIAAGTVSAAGRGGGILGFCGDELAEQNNVIMNNVLLNMEIRRSVNWTGEDHFHRIVGTFDSSKSNLLDHNIASTTVNIKGLSSSRDYFSDKTSPEGQTSTVTALQTKSLYQGINFLFGNSEHTPWKITANNYPVLWFMPDMTTEVHNPNVEISVFPNPCKTRLHIKTTSNVNKIEVYSMTGQLIKSVMETSSVDLSQLQSTIYLVKVNTDAGIFTCKVRKEP